MNQAIVSGKRFSHQQFRPVGRQHSTRRKFLGRILAIMGVASLVLCASAPAWAVDGTLDPSFNPGAGVGRAPILWGQYNYTDGTNKSLIVGAFTMVGDKPHYSIARINSEGTPDESFQAPMEISEVRGALLLDANPNVNTTKILISGLFSVTAGGKTYNGLARLLPSGAVDTSFVSSFEVGGDYVSGFAVQPDGKILVVGASMVVKGYPGVYCFLRLDTDGSVDDTYPKRQDAGGYIHNVYAYPSTGTRYPNAARLCGTIPRFDGSGHLDYMLILGSDGNTVIKRLGDEVVDGPIISLTVESGTLLAYITGMFTTVYGHPRCGVARLDAELTGVDDSFDPGTGANHLVRGASIQTDGNVVLRGFFTSFRSDPSRKYMVRLQRDGTLDNSFNPGTGPDDCVWSMWQKTDTSWMVLGAFRSINGPTRHGIANLDADGGLNPAYSGVTLYNFSLGKVYATALQSDGKVLIGGSFSSCGGKYHGGVARLNPDGSTDDTFQGRASGATRRISVQPDGKILLAGSLYSMTGYTARTGVVRMNPDGSMDNTFNPLVLRPDGSYGNLNAVRVLDNGQIVIAGEFSSVNGVSRSIAARLESSGALDNTFTVGLTLPGTDIAARRLVPTLTGDKYLLLGNYLPTGSATQQGFLTRLNNNGTNDPTWGPNPAQQQNIVGTSAPVSTLQLQADGKVLVCGDFTQVFAGGVSDRSHIARITADGQLDTTFIPLATNDSIKTLAVQRNGKVLIGGSFTSPFNRLARLNPDGALDLNFDPGEGVDSTIHNFVHIPAQGKALIAGEFITFNAWHGFSRPGIAKILASDSGFSSGFLLLLE
jgi:uncharacterized delta-60 repeat protein